jgi:hypothetical protein
VVGYTVVEREGRVLGEPPQRGRHQHLGVRVQQPQRVGLRRHALGLEPRVAGGALEQQAAVAGDCDLRAGIPALGDLRIDEAGQPLEPVGAEARGGEVADRQGKGVHPPIVNPTVGSGTMPPSPVTLHASTD